jgi:hypothetical protein
LTAKISKITNEGIVTISFNKDVMVIKNLSKIDYNVISVTILAGADSDPKDLNITSWNVTSKKIPYLSKPFFKV